MIAYECFCLYGKLHVAKSLVTLRSTRRTTKGLDPKNPHQLCRQTTMDRLVSFGPKL
jgi:hypothetical protein